jgi:hypothetical protein
MAKSRKATEIAARQLAMIAERQLGKLPPLERAKRLMAFERIVAKVGDSPARLPTPRETEKNCSERRRHA